MASGWVSFHLCGSIVNKSSFEAFPILGKSAMILLRYSLGFTLCALHVARSEQTTAMLTAASWLPQNM